MRSRHLTLTCLVTALVASTRLNMTLLHDSHFLFSILELVSVDHSKAMDYMNSIHFHIYDLLIDNFHESSRRGMMTLHKSPTFLPHLSKVMIE